MSETIEWSTDEVDGALAELESASSTMSGMTLSSPSGCGWSAGDASAAVNDLKNAIDSIKTSIGRIRTQIQSANDQLASSDAQTAEEMSSAGNNEDNGD